MPTEKRGLSLFIRRDGNTTVYASTGNQIQQDGLDEKLLVTPGTATQGHIERESCKQGHVDEHESVYGAPIVQQGPDSNYVDRQCPTADQQAYSRPAKFSQIYPLLQLQFCRLCRRRGFVLGWVRSLVHGCNSGMARCDNQCNSTDTAFQPWLIPIIKSTAANKRFTNWALVCKCVLRNSLTITKPVSASSLPTKTPARKLSK